MEMEAESKGLKIILLGYRVWVPDTKTWSQDPIAAVRDCLETSNTIIWAATVPDSSTSLFEDMLGATARGCTVVVAGEAARSALQNGVFANHISSGAEASLMVLSGQEPPGMAALTKRAGSRGLA